MKGLMIMRAQPLHNGHCKLIYKALLETSSLTLVLGSVQESGTLSNPFSFEDRLMMIKKVFGASDRLNIIPVEDLGRGDKFEWILHVFDKIRSSGYNIPNKYYAGSDHDASWMRSYVEEFDAPVEIEVLNRFSSGIMSATEIRKAIISECSDWESHVPSIIVGDIRLKFPEYLIGSV